MIFLRQIPSSDPYTFLISKFFFPEELPSLERVCHSWRAAFGSEKVWKQKCKDEGVEWHPIEQILLTTWKPAVSKVIILVADYLGYGSQQSMNGTNVFKRQFACPKPPLAFGPDKWRLHWNYSWHIEEDNDWIGAPQLPPSIHRDLAFGKMRNHTLTLVSSGHSLGRIIGEAAKPLEGPSVIVKVDEQVLEEFRNFCVPRACWVAIPKTILKESRNTNWMQSKSIADAEPDLSRACYRTDYRMGHIVELVMSFIGHYWNTGECLFADGTYSWSLSRDLTWGAAVGRSLLPKDSKPAELRVVALNEVQEFDHLGVVPVTSIRAKGFEDLLLSSKKPT